MIEGYVKVKDGLWPQICVGHSDSVLIHVPFSDNSPSNGT